MVYVTGNEQLQLTYVLNLLSVRSSIHWVRRSGSSTAGYFWGARGEPVFKGSIFRSVDLLTMDFAVMVVDDQWLKQVSFGPSIG